MKTKYQKYVALVMAAGLLAGCSQSIETASKKFNELPPPVQKTIRAQAPEGEIASISTTTVNGMDAYEVEFRQNGQNPKVIVAANGSLLSSELANSPGMLQKALTPTGATGTPLSALPLPAQKTIQEHGPNAQIGNISRHEDNGRVIYEVSFKDQGKNPTIQVAEDGTLVQTLQK